MNTYKVGAEKVNVNGVEATLFRVGFADPAQNDQIVKDAEVRFKEIFAEADRSESADDMGPVPAHCGELALVNGPASVAVALVIGHNIAHRFGAVAAFDPKLPGDKKYVVCITHTPKYKLGDLVG